MLSYLEVSTLHIFHGKTLSLSMEELQQGLKHCKKSPKMYLWGVTDFIALMAHGNKASESLKQHETSGM